MGTVYQWQSNLFTNNSKILVGITTTVANLKTAMCMFNNFIVYKLHVFTIV